MSQLNKSTSLYKREGSSDKVYHVDLLAAEEDGFLVKARWGRRGASLQSGSKTRQPVSLAEATKIFNGIVNEKKGKGYTEGVEGTPYQGGPNAERVSGVVPQLLNPITAAELEALLRDDRYVAQEKHDGERRLIRVSAAGVDGINRKGLIVALPLPVATAAVAGGDFCVIDGELVGDVLHAFDLLEHEGGSVRHRPFHERFVMLQAKLSRLEAGGAIRLVETAHGEEAKRELFGRVHAAKGEGIVLKLAAAHYAPGKPSSGGTQFKFKFTESATCRVASQHAEKRSIGLELLDAGVWTNVGNVGIPVNYEIPAVGALCEVRYLYANPGGSLQQPIYAGTRSDLTESEATTSQLKYKPGASEEDEEG